MEEWDIDVDFDLIFNDIKDKIEEDNIRIILNYDKKPKLADSKFGGIPYWDKNKEYPLDEYGNKMYLLAQINFEKESLMDPLPNKGLLQFFVEEDNFEEYKVIYHENIDYSITIKDIEEMGIPNSANKIDEYYPTPIHGEFALEFLKNKSYMNCYEDRFSEILADSLKKLFDKDIDDLDYDFEDEFFEYMYDNVGYGDSAMLGYHFFTQCDGGKPSDDYVLLLQIDSEQGEKDYYIQWGDDGVCNFFIKKEDLKNLNFENVVFYWDCY